MHAESLTPPAHAEAAHTPVQVVSIDALVQQDAVEYHLNYKDFYDTLSCESAGFKDVTIQSQYIKDGKQEDSFGLAQINLGAHPDISYASATDPTFAIQYAAQQFSKGNADQWTCYRLIKSGKWSLQ